MVLQDGVSPREKPYTGHHGGFPFITGGVSLATSRMSSKNPDLQDVSAVMAAFQEMNRVEIVLTGRVVDVGGAQQLRLLVEAHDRNSEIGEAPSLAFVSVILGYGYHRTMEGAIMWALYQLDWKLVDHELESTKKTA